MRRLIVAVGPAMLRVIRTIVGPNVADAEDVLQDASEAFLTAIGSFKGRGSVLHFACRGAGFPARGGRRRLALRSARIVDDAEIDERPAEGGLSPAEMVMAV